MRPVSQFVFPFPGEPREAPFTRDILETRYAEESHRPAIRLDGRWYSYSELGSEVHRFANALTALGVKPGQRAGVFLPNGMDFVRAWLGLIALNVTMVPINVNLRGASLEDILRGADLDVLITDQPGAETLAAAARAQHLQARMLVMGAGDDLDQAMAVASDTTPTPAAMPVHSDVALIIFTSGTTGPSKGVVLSRLAQFWHGANYLRDFIQLGPGETGYTPLPLFHVSAQGFVLGCLLGGASVVVDDAFHPFSFWKTVRETNARAFNYVGAMVPLLLQRPSTATDLDNPVERAVGSATPADLHEAFEQRFGVRLIESYGQTETAGLWLSDPHWGRTVGRMGTPIRWFDAVVLDAEDLPARPGVVGEIVLRPRDSLLMAERYFRNPEATDAAFRPNGYHTGDAGEVNTSGSIRFAGRLKDFIRRRGENISAFDIERAALEHPDVIEAAAVAIPSPLTEDDVQLAVILREGAEVHPRQLDSFLAKRLPSFMRPEYIEFRDDFPRTPTQRVQKYKLREEGLAPGAWRRRKRLNRRNMPAD